MLLPCSLKLLTRLSYSGYSNQLYGLIDDEDVPSAWFTRQPYQVEAGISLTISRTCFLCPQLLLRITISFSCIHSFPLPLLWHLHIAVLPECILFALDSLSSCSASPSLAAFTCWKTHLSPQCNCKPFVIASACGCGRGSSPFFDTIKFPCRLILNARRILIIFIENAL